MGELQDQIKALNADLKEKKDHVEMNIKQAIINACLRVEREVKLLMKDTPTMSLEVRSAMTESGKKIGRKVGKTGKVHLPSEPGEAPAIDQGTLVRSYTHNIENDGMTGFVGSNIVYARRLEFGDSKMLARPALGPALRNTSEKNHRDFQLAIGNPEGPPKEGSE